MPLTRIKTNNILDREVKEQDLADGAVTFTKIAGISGGLSGHVLTTDGAGNLLWTTAAGAPTALDTLTNVDTTGALNGDSLVYNSTSGMWEAGSNVPSSLGLNSLVDVTFVTPLQQHEFVRFNGTEWTNSRVTAAMVQSLAPVGLTGLFGDLADVDMDPGPSVNQTIKWTGDRWVPGDLTDFGSIDNFDDVDTSTVPPTNGQALAFNGSEWVPQTIGGLGAASNTFVVDDIAARNALSPAEGDSCFVRTGVSGEYELYLWDAAWILISTEDSARTDANTAEAIVLFNTGSPVLIGNVSDGSRITNVSIEVTTVFDGTPTLSVGDDGDNARLIDDNMFDLSNLGTYVCNTDYVYDGTEVVGTADTDIKAYFNFAGSTTGEARIIVTHV